MNSESARTPEEFPIAFTIWFVVDGCIVLSTEVRGRRESYTLGMARETWDSLAASPKIQMRSARP